MSIVIDIDGIDGSGGETQKIKLRDYLKSKKMNPFIKSYPDYESPFGGIIRDFLDGKIELTAEEQFAIFAADMVKNKYDFEGAIGHDRIVVRESGPNRTCAYQVAAGYDLEKATSFQKKVQRLADLVLFIDIPPEVGLRRKKSDNESPDRFEKNMEFLRKVRSVYTDLVKSGGLGKKYVVIDGTKSIEDVHKEIVKHVEEVLSSQF